MKAIRVDAFGPPAEVVRYLEVPEPEPVREGEVLVSVEATPIHPSDLRILSGMHGALPRLPTIPGKEGVGRVLSIGPAVQGIEIGDRVLLPLGAGAWRERIKVAAKDVIPVPLNKSDKSDESDESTGSQSALALSMARVNPLAAHALLFDMVKLERGDWVVHNAASSSLGHWIIHFAKEAGIQVASVARREASCDSLLERGARVVVVDGAELGKRITAATRGAQIRLGIDAVAGSATARIAACVDDGGSVINCGMLSGEPCQIAPNDLIFRRVELRGFWLLSHLSRADDAKTRARVDTALSKITSGAVQIGVEATYTLDQIKEAVTHAQRGALDGKIVLLPNG